MRSIILSAGLVVLAALLFAGSKAPNPLITSVSPSQPIVQTGEVTIVVNGQNFVNKDQVSLFEGANVLRPTRFVNNTELLVQLQAGDLVNPAYYLLTVVGPSGNKVGQGFPWTVTDGTVTISPGDAVVGLNGQVQFSATSTIPGDTVTWTVSSSNCVSPTITAAGLYTAPNRFCEFTGGVTEQDTITATSVTDSSKLSQVVVTVQ